MMEIAYTHCYKLCRAVFRPCGCRISNEYSGEAMVICRRFRDANFSRIVCLYRALENQGDGSLLFVLRFFSVALGLSSVCVIAIL